MKPTNEQLALLRGAACVPAVATDRMVNTACHMWNKHDAGHAECYRTMLNEAPPAYAEALAALLAEREAMQKELGGVGSARDCLRMVLRGMEGGHIKCAPYFDFDPEAEKIEFKSVPQLVRETLAKLGEKE